LRFDIEYHQLTIIRHGNDGSALFGNDFATMLALGSAQGAFSAIRGGKFANGAMSGAFIYMFNAEMKSILRGQYKNTESILKKMKNGDIVFGKRALGGIIRLQMGDAFDAIDQEIVHEQVFFKINNKIFNIGFSNGEWLINESSKGYVFSEIYHVNDIGYVLSAAENFNPNEYSLIGNNCQSFSTAVANRIRIDQGY